MMKKIIAIGLSAFILFGFIAKPEDVINVVKKDGLYVLDIEQKENYSTIVCEVKTNEEFGFVDDEYLPCENIFDKLDFPLIDKRDAEVGDILQVTFFHDDVVKVKKNNKKIIMSVDGQEKF